MVLISYAESTVNCPFMVWLLQKVPIGCPWKERTKVLFPPEEALSRAANGEALLRLVEI